MLKKGVIGLHFVPKCFFAISLPDFLISVLHATFPCLFSCFRYSFPNVLTDSLAVGVDQYEDRCMGGFTLLMYWSWLILFNAIFIIPLVLGVVGWILYILVNTSHHYFHTSRTLFSHTLPILPLFFFVLFSIWDFPDSWKWSGFAQLNWYTRTQHNTARDRFFSPKCIRSS